VIRAKPRRPLATGLTTAFAPQGTRPFHLEGRCGRRSMRRASCLHPLCVVWKGVDVGNLARLREHLSVPIVEFDSKPPSGLGSMVGLLRSGLHTP
jgi:hypothetical protein